MPTHLVLLLAGLSVLGPLGIDMYLPAFQAIGADLGASTAAVQQTLGVYLACLATMMLCYGTLSDACGRRRVLLWATAVHAVAALTVACAPDIDSLIAGRALQGLSAGAGGVVGRAIVQDMTRGAATQRALSSLIMVFALAPAVAPIVGGWFLQGHGWRSIFFLQAIFAALMWAWSLLGLPESLPKDRRNDLRLRTVCSAYRTTASDLAFQLAVTASSLAFLVFSLYIGAAATFVTDVLDLPVTAFGWLFVPLVAGMVLGSALAVRLAGWLTRPHQLIIGYALLTGAGVFNVCYWASASPVLPWSVLPLGLTTFGLALINPCLMLMATEKHTANRGLAHSLFSFEQTLAFAAVTAWLSPLLASSGLKLALAVLVGGVLSACCAAWLHALKKSTLEKHSVIAELEL
ncbi:multidrug effflux MFS transporter [Pseudomonas fulva]|uniref:multidrug effflux MFS transporter n=1 Tax=Pseudomonas fulva TaxID=47880 RepID=UPI003CF748F8